jgi:hypothetical protein
MVYNKSRSHKNVEYLKWNFGLAKGWMKTSIDFHKNTRENSSQLSLKSGSSGRFNLLTPPTPKTAVCYSIKQFNVCLLSVPKQSKKPSVFVSTYEDGIKRVLDGNYAFLMESTMLDYAVQRDCNLTQIGGNFLLMNSI